MRYFGIRHSNILANLAPVELGRSKVPTEYDAMLLHSSKSARRWLKHGRIDNIGPKSRLDKLDFPLIYGWVYHKGGLSLVFLPEELLYFAIDRSLLE